MNPLDVNRSALLVMDLQKEIVSRVGDRANPVVEKASGVIAAARKAGIPVVYVIVGFRPGYPEISPRNASFAAVTQSGRMIVTDPREEVLAAVRPQENDVIVVKRRVSAFTGTDLEVVLRAKGVDTLILMGVATSGVVLSTVRHGADADYKLVVVKDACMDMDDEVHRVLTEKVFVRQATVLTASETIASLGAA